MAASAYPNTGNPYSVLSREEARGVLKDPAYSWRWALVLPIVSGYVEQTYTGGTNGAAIQSPGIQSKPKVPFGIASAVEFAPDDMGTEGRFGGGTSLSFPRHDISQNFQVSLYENYLYEMTQYLFAWKSEITDGDNNFGMPTDYKKQIKFFAFDIKSNTKSVMQVTVTDSYPTSAVGGLSYGVDNGMLTVNSEFTADLIEYTFSPA